MTNLLRDFTDFRPQLSPVFPKDFGSKITHSQAYKVGKGPIRVHFSKGTLPLKSLNFLWVNHLRMQTWQRVHPPVSLDTGWTLTSIKPIGPSDY